MRSGAEIKKKGWGESEYLLQMALERTVHQVSPSDNASMGTHSKRVRPGRKRLRKIEIFLREMRRNFLK